MPLRESLAAAPSAEFAMIEFDHYGAGDIFDGIQGERGRARRRTARLDRSGGPLMPAAAQGTTARAPQGSGPVGVGFIGTGMISDTYLEHLTAFPDVRVVILGDLDVDRARAQAEK